MHAQFTNVRIGHYSALFWIYVMKHKKKKTFQLSHLIQENPVDSVHNVKERASHGHASSRKLESQ